MALFSHLRKLLGLTLAMLIVATSVQPVQARLSYVDGNGTWIASLPTAIDPLGSLDAALYISEENENQAGRKGPSHRLGADEPTLIVVELPSAVLIPVLLHVPPYRAPPADTGVFFPPLKTGPPSL
jgi:hypothetical protein